MKYIELKKLIDKLELVCSEIYDHTKVDLLDQYSGGTSLEDRFSERWMYRDTNNSCWGEVCILESTENQDSEHLWWRPCSSSNVVTGEDYLIIYSTDSGRENIILDPKKEISNLYTPFSERNTFEKEYSKNG